MVTPSTPHARVHHFKILDSTDVDQILALFGIRGVNCNGYSPGFNRFNESTLNWYFKNPDRYLKHAYFKPRFNPYQLKYPYADYQYTLDDMLSYQNAPFIEEAFIFWDANKTLPNEQVNYHLVPITIAGETNQTTIREQINNYLLNNRIISTTKVINLNSYNMSVDCGLVLPLPAGTYQNQAITAVYFDGGIRIIENPSKYSLADLLKLTNGANNVYLFTIKTPQKINIINHHVANMEEIVSLMQSNYNIKIDGVDIIPSFNIPMENCLYYYFKNPDSNLLGAYFEAYPNKSYPYADDTYTLQDMLQKHDTIKTAHVFWFDKEKAAKTKYNKDLKQYEIDLQNWKDQRIFKAGNVYRIGEIRAILGNNNRLLYCLDRGKIKNITDPRGGIGGK
ncbi:conserved hypothetical protein [Candidatus Phytoplasma mali]|uniref:Uncharacterized protein n=1 Tax=Phytoplasma mali (strain AT) TaxID=482235 RepID=B3QZR3_PHYMT|nr:hypothetical protein [Candidatus Phytoplasma mali]CAP18450.1 conserved hypothetical protein [Candidatus Phytoplasma mali]